MTGRDDRTPAEPGEPGLTPVPEATRGGEDVRRRGWFWHWNSLVTQYAPLIGLKGVGLLNSYTVWTDRREESPHRGYAFPSQQREADFYGEDRAELIAINKILVALDLIEIRKEMVLRTDPQGRRWRVPHNFYRVKDHGDDFSLTTDDVLRVTELADRDRAVYRYVRRVFSPRFAPIDADNVWTRILPEVRQHPVWQRLAERTEREETRASARTKAGHAARKATVEPAPASEFFVPASGDDPASGRVDSDSATGAISESGETSVAPVNTGSAPDVASANTGLQRNQRTLVGRVNQARSTAVAPANTTYHQDELTTTTAVGMSENGDSGRDARGSGHEESGDPTDSIRQPEPQPTSFAPPNDGPGRAAAIRAFEEANDRAATPAERRLLTELAERFEPAARTTGRSGWVWLAAAAYEAVEAGSAFVAPRRLREILGRWEREGYPQTDESGFVGTAMVVAAPRPPDAPDPPRETGRRVATPTPVGDAEPAAANFMVVECGL
ncbi:MAG: hypothetical protein IT337_00355, partial [Thermomicrobiales bacterium]|nr:hypothetical protein [Thermomicrobiales bacterium]